MFPPGESGPRLTTRVRLAAWLGAAAGLSFGTAPNFVGLLNQSLGDTFGNVFPAIPFAALLTLIFALRWGDLRELLSREGGPSSEGGTRALGGSIIVTLLVLEPVTGRSVVTAGLAVVMTFYASSLVINPGTRRFLLPYAAI